MTTTQTPATGHVRVDTQTVHAGGGTPTPHTNHHGRASQGVLVGVGPDFPYDQVRRGAHGTTVVAAPTFPPLRPDPAIPHTMPKLESLGLDDPFLRLAADVLDDLERVRIANENRLRQLTRSVEDVDGEERGFGLDLSHPDVARLAALVDALKTAEHQAELNLAQLLKKHPLWPWMKTRKGIGPKQGARLLAAIGDPYWNATDDIPRRVSDLWSYCGYGDHQAQVRRKGVKSNWSADAKKRLYLIAESCKKSRCKACVAQGKTREGSAWIPPSPDCTCLADGCTYRAVYDAAKIRYADAVHTTECARCTGKGQPPAEPGTPMKDGHREGCATRAVSKQILKDLWIEARRLHGVWDED